MNTLHTSSFFDGYLRSDGRVGTRNVIGVLVVGNCAATAARRVADYFTEARLADYPNVDGVVPFVHELGCGMEKSGEPMDLLRRSLGGTIRNANLAGAVVMALGCERNNIYGFLEQEALVPGAMLKTVVLQEVGGTQHAIDQGIAAVYAMLEEANRCHRQPSDLRHLVVGVVTELAARDTTIAQAIELAVDVLVQQGATVVLTHTTQTAPSFLKHDEAVPVVAVREALTHRVQWWDQYNRGRDTGSDAEKEHAGAAAASLVAGMALSGVFGYAHALPSNGVLLMDSPGNEAVAATGLVASGATLICMASRSASTFGAAGVPTVKLGLDAAHWQRFSDDLDIDSSVVGSVMAAPQLAERIVAAWIAYASGKRTNSELWGIGESAFMPWPIGVLA